VSKLRWGLLACGRIAEAFAAGVEQSDSGEVVAVASRNAERAEAFGARFGISHCHGSYEALLADPDVDAIYISTPHPMHAEWAIKAAEAGKHILCEKPIAMNHADAKACVDAARTHDVFLMEAFMYRCQPLMAKVVELVRAGAIGDVQLIRASFGFRCPFDLDSRLLSHALGGGGILDVGCYPVSFSRLIAGVALGQEFANPLQVKGLANVGAESGVDEWACAVLEFPGNILAQVSTGVQCAQDNGATIFGSEGQMDIPTPWFASGKEEGGSGDIIIRAEGQAPETITVETDKGIYGIEADLVAASIANRQAPSPAMTWEDTLGNMATLDAWRREIGLSFAADSASS
jgi:predicted dehydrogenase